MEKITGYTIHEKIYEGNRYTIYRSTRNADQKKVILKNCVSEQPHLTDLAKLQHEYQILKQLDLNGIIKVYDLIKHRHQLTLVLEDMEGQSLRSYLKKQPLDLNRFFKIALQIVDAIGEIHLQHIIHKDINPSNIIINPKTLVVKLVDFSISTQLTQETQDNISPKNLEGTLAYISPEQTGRMNRSIDYRTDFYSLGITFYEMLTGKLPFQTEDTLELIHNHLAKTPEPLTQINPTISPIINSIVSKLLAKMPEKRYASASGLKSDLLQCQLQWESEHQIQNFTLGQYDIKDHLIVSQKLYGREQEVGQLLAAFEHICLGHSRLVFVSGYSGIGKTSLVKEIYKPVVRKQGYFISGKYDQLQRTTPYTAIIEAFQEFIRNLLTESEERLAAIKESLINALGNNGEVITNIIPNLELIIGIQPHVPELPPTESLNRFMHTFQKFVLALAQPEHPLVVFLDDLQWIDSASMQLLELLMTDNDLQHFLMIGAYRDNEVSADHPLTILQLQLEKAGVTFNNLSLTPLKQQDIQHLLADSLTASADKVPELADLIFNKTQGNPFFINEFLKKLFHEKLLFFSYPKREWRWNIDKIKTLAITDNVVDLLITRIHLLPESTQNLLELAACIGHTFDLSTLSIISEKNITVTAQNLLQATYANFIVPVNDNYRTLESIATETVPMNHNNKKIKYRFIHDRVQQAAYQLIPEAIKQDVHLQIGRLLIKDKQLESRDEQLFDILNHFNNSLNRITEIEEKLQLAQYNLWAGEKAKAATAYQAAKEYLRAGVFLLKDIQSEIKNDLLFSLSKELATCQYLTGEFEIAEKSFNELLLQAKETLSTIEIYKLNCEMLATLNKHEEAIKLGLKVLSSIHIKIPIKPNKAHILWQIFKIKLLIGRRKIETIDLLPMKSKKYKAAAQLLSQLLNSAFVTDQNLFVLLACTNVRLALQYGLTDSTTFSCLVYAFSVMHGLKWYDEGIAFSKLYQKLRENQLAPNHFEGKNLFILGCFIDPWRYPLDTCIDELLKSYQSTYDSGDMVYSNYSNLMMIFTIYMVGKSFNDVKKSAQNNLSFIKKTGTNDFKLLSEFWIYSLDCLVNDIFSTEKMDEYEHAILAGKNNTEISFFYSLSTKLYYLLGHFDKAIQSGLKFENYAQYSLGLIPSLEGRFYYALALIANHPLKLNSAYLKKLKKILANFKTWANWCPINFKGYLLLLDAEMSRITKKNLMATQQYKQALNAVENQIPLQAVINECIARYYLDLELPEIAKIYMTSAHYLYQSWGAQTKSFLLKNQYPDLFKVTATSLPQHSTTTTTDNSLTSIDMLSLMKSAQAISGEIQLNKLLQKLLIVLLQNAGAHRGILISKEGEGWYVEAEGTIAAQKITLAQVERIEHRTDLPLSLIRYVQRTQETILVQSPKDFESFIANDKYLSKTKPQSILIIPILHQGKLQTILYLENRVLSQAFNREHVNILQILSSQAAISLQNARLYYQATHDTLTGLANRNLLYQMFNLAAGKAKRNNTLIAILFLDLDFFKKINDTLGHEIGDKLLLSIAETLTLNLREGDLAVRLGGDEFVVMLDHIDVSQASHIAARFVHYIKEPRLIQGHEIHITSSIGISIYPYDGDDISDLLKQADIALYRVKANAKGSYQFYTSSLDQQLKEENRLEIELRSAIENNELLLYYQPVYSANKHEILYFEALVRWQHPKKGLLTAEFFIPLAEETGLILSIGERVLKDAVKQIKTWISTGIKPVPIAVNISGLQFRAQTVSSLIAKLLQESDIDARYLQLEFTESVSIEYTENVLADIAALKKMGIHLTLDDFGTYYSSLSYLRQAMLDKIKIDQTFVHGIDDNNKGDRELIIGIILMAHSLNLQVVAEGVETKEQMKFLEDNNIDELQGYYLNYPMSSDDCTKLLSADPDSTASVKKTSYSNPKSIT